MGYLTSITGQLDIDPPIKWGDIRNSPFLPSERGGRPGQGGEEMSRSPFPEEAWDQIFSEVPDYPTNLPDDVVRYIADLAIHVRELAANLEAGLESGNRLTTLMGLSLISGSVKRIEAFVASEFERGGFR